MIAYHVIHRSLRGPRRLQLEFTFTGVFACTVTPPFSCDGCGLVFCARLGQRLYQHAILLLLSSRSAHAISLEGRMPDAGDNTRPSQTACTTQSSNTKNAANSKSSLSRPTDGDFARSQSWAPPIPVTPESKALQSLKVRMSSCR